MSLSPPPPDRPVPQLSSASAGTTGASSSPMIRRGSIAKPCCVVGCAVKREKDGYCMSHYKLFKQNISSQEETARAKQQAKQLEEMTKERARLEKEDAAARQKRSSAIHAAASGQAGGGGGGSGQTHSWWRRGSKTLGAKSCFAAAGPSSPQGAPGQRFEFPSGADASPLLLEVRRAWSTAHKVVFKDLPRLAKRTSIQTEEMGTLIDSGRIVRIPKPVTMQPLAVPAPAAQPAAATAGAANHDSIAAAAPCSSNRSSRIGRSHSFTLPASSSSSAAASSAASTFTSHPLTRASLLPSTSWESWAGLENEPWAVKEQTRRIFLEERERKRRRELEQYGGSEAQTTGTIREEQAQQQLHQDAASPSSSLSSPLSAERQQDAAADFRSSMRESQLGSPTVPSAPYVDTHLSGPDVDPWQAVCNVLLCCLEALEPTEVAFAARSALAVATSGMHQGSDHQSVLEQIFTDFIGLESRTFKVWQAIHQAILFPAIAHLHQRLYSHPAIGNLKDCRRPDGWTILIHIGAAIYVTHQRWEQTLHPETDVRHVEVRWEMRLSFDKQMSQLRAVILRIQEIRFHADASDEYRKQITNVLAGSGYIV